MSKETMIKILMADRCTKSEAEKYVKSQSVIIWCDINEFYNDMLEWYSDEEIRDMFINGNNLPDCSAVDIDDNLYIIAYEN